MEVDAADFSLDLVEAYIVETLKAGPIDRPNAMIRHQKVLLPPHKYKFLLSNIGYNDGPLFGLLLVRSEWLKLGPMAQVHLGIGTPVIVFCEEAVPCSDDFAFEICCESWVIFRET